MMLHRTLLTLMAVMALGAPSVLAGGSGLQIWMLAKHCGHGAVSSQCAYQTVTGNHNIAVTEQFTSMHGKKHRSVQFSLTKQHGDDNKAYTGQFGQNQVSTTSQNGNDNGAYTYQEGKHQASQTSETGNGQWSSTSSIGDHTTTSVVLTSF